MEVRNSITAETLVAALNVAPPNLLEQRRFRERYIAAGGSLPRQETRPFANALLSLELRAYVDKWLNSGVEPDGSESPSKRELSGRLYATVLEYLDRYPPLVQLPPRAGPKVVLAQPVQFASEAKGSGQLFAATGEEAQRLFTGLLMSDWRESLCKCRYPFCGRYFLLARPWRVRKHGTFCCREHQARASAAACTKERRATAYRELVEFAAKWLTEWGVRSPDWVNNDRVKRRLAGALSRYVGRKRNLRALRQNIQVKWVTRHRLAIEQKRTL